MFSNPRHADAARLYLQSAWLPNHPDNKLLEPAKITVG